MRPGSPMTLPSNGAKSARINQQAEERPQSQDQQQKANPVFPVVHHVFIEPIGARDVTFFDPPLRGRSIDSARLRLMTQAAVRLNIEASRSAVRKPPAIGVIYRAWFPRRAT